MQLQQSLLCFVSSLLGLVFGFQFSVWFCFVLYLNCEIEQNSVCTCAKGRERERAMRKRGESEKERVIECITTRQNVAKIAVEEKAAIKGKK